MGFRLELKTPSFHFKKPIMKKLLLKLIVWIIYKYSEITPPDLKYSDRNYKVAKAALSVEDLANLF